MYLLPSLTQCAQLNVNKITLTNPQRELTEPLLHILEHGKNIHVWKVSEKGYQCIKAASLYETLIKYSTQVLRV